MKKVFAMVLAVAMMACMFAGCGSSAPASTAAPAASAAPASEATAASSAPIKVGGIGPVTGPAAIYGKAVETAMKIAVEEVNALGGVQFELNFQDDAHDAETSVNAYGNLMDWGMQVLVGTVTSTPCAAVAAEAAADRVFVLTPSASSPSVTEGRDNVFQMCFSDPNQGSASATYIANNNMSEAIAVIYNNGDAYSTGIYEKFMAEAEDKGLNVVYTGTFTDDSATDFSAQLTAAKDAGADMLFLPMYYTPISVIMNQCAAMNWDVKYFGVDGMDGVLAQLGEENAALANGVFLLTPFAADSTDPVVVNFVTKYKAAYNETPDQFAADAYDTVYAMKAAMEKAGSVESADLIAAMTEITVDGLTGEGITWTADGEPNKGCKFIQIKDGAYTLYE